MKWFIKVLRHYADFSGRARRKEYWYFALFNSIAAIAAMMIDVIAGWDLASRSVMGLPNYGPCYLTYVVAMLLPGLAVAVRRLHDVGKSGWWMFLSLIPIVGAIWLFILFCTEGQSEQNRYGTNPKSVKPSFPECRREKSIAIAFIVGAVVGLGGLMSNWIRHDFFTDMPFWFWLIPTLTTVLTLLFGLFYYPAGDSGQTAKRRKIAFILLAMGLLISVIQTILALSEIWSYSFSELKLIWLLWANNIFFVLRNLAVLALIILLLFKSERKKMAPVAILSIVLIAIDVAKYPVWSFVMHKPFGIIGFIAFILLAAHCLRTKEAEEPLQALQPLID